MVAYTKIEFKKRDVRLKDIPKFYQELIENKVSIGIHKAQGSHNVEKAFWNEFGTTQVLIMLRIFKRLLITLRKLLIQDQRLITISN